MKQQTKEMAKFPERWAIELDLIGREYIEFVKWWPTQFRQIACNLIRLVRERAQKVVFMHVGNECCITNISEINEEPINNDG